MDTATITREPTTHDYAIPDAILSDLVNAALEMRYLAKHHHRMDAYLHDALTDGSDAIDALIALADRQHPVALPTSQVRVIQAEGAVR